MNKKTSASAASVEALLKPRLICVAVIENPDDAVPLAEALLAGGLDVMEVTFRTSKAAEAISRIRKELPKVHIGAGTLLSPDQVRQAVDAGAQFGVAPGLNEDVVRATKDHNMPFFPGVMTPTEIDRAMNLGCQQLKFFPAEAAGGAPLLKALAAPFAHTGLQLIPTGGISATTLPVYLALPQVAAVGGSWMAERKLINEHAWAKITALTTEAMKLIAATKT